MTSAASSSLLVLVVFIFVSLPPIYCLSERCHPNDKKALLQIKKSLNNAYHFASWEPDTDCCDWYVVGCHRSTNRINALTVFSAEISGQIPAAVGDLPYLETLQFHKITNLTGKIPPAIAKLTRLKMLILSWTNLTGPVPSFISTLKKLTFLELSHNQLTGTIPPALSQLQNLEGIYLDRNRLTGSIPESFGEFTGRVPSLYLSHNQLTGTVPKSLGRLNYTTIDLSRNKLSGDASHLFGSNKSVWKVDLSRNAFKFSLTEVVFPESLESLDLNHNKIYGSLPESLTGLNLQIFNVSYNRLCGKIPTGGKLQTFEQTEYFHNRCLCGVPLPKC